MGNGNRPLPGQTDAGEKKDGIVMKSKHFIDGAVLSLKGRDLHQLVEEFTSEMTLVAEGVSEEQERAAGELAQLSARQTVFEEGLRRQEQRAAEQFKALEKRLDALEKKAGAEGRGKRGLASVLRQATWLAGIIAAAWVITALLSMIGGQ